MTSGAGRSEVKEKRPAKPVAGDMSGARHPAASARRERAQSAERHALPHANAPSGSAELARSRLSCNRFAYWLNAVLTRKSGPRG